MRKAVLSILMLAVIACTPRVQEVEKAAEPEPAAAPTEVVDSYPDPGTAEAQEVQDFVSSWVAKRSGDDGTFAIPPRAGHEVSGKMADFHTVHQKDADTYSVCIDFHSGEQLYDVDFFVDRTADGLAIADHYLHKIDGEAVE